MAEVAGHLLTMLRFMRKNDTAKPETTMAVAEFEALIHAVLQKADKGQFSKAA